MLDLRTLVPWANRHEPATTPATPAGRDADPFTAFRREMDRLFDDTFGSRLPAMARGSMVMPRMDVDETDSDIVVTLELPGVDEKDVTIDLTGDLLTIKGEKKDEKEVKEDGRHVVERSYGSFTRALRLPYGMDATTVEAAIDKGVLTIRLPKPAEARQEPRRIEIRRGTDPAGQPRQETPTAA